jgi:hypothetical protein
VPLRPGCSSRRSRSPSVPPEKDLPVVWQLWLFVIPPRAFGIQRSVCGSVRRRSASDPLPSRAKRSEECDEGLRVRWRPSRLFHNLALRVHNAHARQFQ